MKRVAVLVLENDDFLRDALVRMLNKLPCNVTAVSCPAEALKLLDGGFVPAVVISDLKMPGMDGDEFCKIFLQRFPNVPVTLLSGTPEVYQRGHAAGATHIRMKPLLAADLKVFIEEVQG